MSTAPSMPKSRAVVDSSDDSNSGGEEPKPKKSKSDKPSSSSAKAPLRDDEGCAYWELSNNKRVKVRGFKGKTYVDIREYYEKGGKYLPGKKGISLNVEQWQFLKSVMSEVDGAVADA